MQSDFPRNSIWKSIKSLCWEDKEALIIFLKNSTFVLRKLHVFWKWKNWKRNCLTLEIHNTVILLVKQLTIRTPQSTLCYFALVLNRNGVHVDFSFSTWHNILLLRNIICQLCPVNQVYADIYLLFNSAQYTFASYHSLQTWPVNRGTNI